MSKPLKVLFVEASSSSVDASIPGELETYSDDAIKTKVFKTQENTVSSLRDFLLGNNFDAVIFDENYTFKDRNDAYKELGLPFNEQGELSDYKVSSIALIQYLRSEFEKANVEAPKMGYIRFGTKLYYKEIFEEINIPDNGDFHLSSGYQRHKDHVKTIFEVCGHTPA